MKMDYKEMYHRLEEIRNVAWGEDIPSPTIQEYKEHHESIQRILKAFDKLIDDMETELKINFNKY